MLPPSDLKRKNTAPPHSRSLFSNCLHQYTERQGKQLGYQEGAMSIDAIEDLVRTYEGVDLNEADTRFHLIDRLLEQVLGWPRNAFRLEKSNTEGYSDYILYRPNRVPALIIEAKRVGTYFQIPPNFNHGKLYREVKVKALLSATDVADALLQAQRYCADEGCEFGAISNGRQLIIFKAFERGKAWKELPALVISDLDYFRSHYTDCVDLLGYSSVIERNSLHRRFKHKSQSSREVFYTKEKINAFNQIINANSLAVVLRPIVQRYFGPLDIEDPELIEKCYVNQRAYDKSLKGIRSLIRDSVSPFMATYGVIETEDSSRGGSFGNRLIKGVMKKGAGDVVVLFGGKGSGKSTFLRRVLQHQPPQYLRKHSLPVVIDLLGAPKEAAAIRDHIWRMLVQLLDVDSILSGDREPLLRLFEDRWTTASKQDLFGFDPSQPTFNEKLNGLVAAWKQDTRYVAERLVRYHAKKHRGVIVAIDNTDQLENELQDYAFSIAEEISREFGCVVLISMREERFYASKMRGMLDAYQNSAFHISSPTPAEVFERRINYVLELVRNRKLELREDLRADLLRFLKIFRSDFQRDPISPLNRFISACAQGNIRLALDLFGELLVSGYTNAKEMIEIAGVWTIQIHQVLRPLMTPTRLFYDEKLSRVPNLLQIRATDGGSHFTGLRILRLLSLGQDPTSPAYVPLAEVRAHFGAVFGNDDDVRAWLDRLLATSLIEASTRQDYFDENIDALRITPFGQFALVELHKIFTYVELISTDCGCREESACNELVQLSNEETQFFNERRRYERVLKRLEKADAFVRYLDREESAERDLFGLVDEEPIVAPLSEALADERVRVLKSAKRNRRGSGSRVRQADKIP
jgi:hypothetical protein